MFDAFLRTRADRSSEPFVAFDKVADYDTYVDAKTRADGTRSFLASRHINLPVGSSDDLAGAETVNGLGRAQNEIVLRKIREDGVEAYPGYIRAVRAAGLHRAVASSSANCVAAILRSATVTTPLPGMRRLGTFVGSIAQIKRAGSAPCTLARYGP
jgi:beta-phosphoglucomutase-like phosphatase (HAD superfamily)